MTSFEVGLKYGFRSGLEAVTARDLEERNIPVVYERFSLEYIWPPVGSRYTPDFVLPNGIIVETKGRFTVDDRKKHLLVKEQHPRIDIRFVFSNPNARISKRSKTTYAAWCAKHGFKYAARSVPQAWIDEPATQEGLMVLRAIK
jgi:hypothetical protein